MVEIKQKDYYSNMYDIENLTHLTKRKKTNNDLAMYFDDLFNIVNNEINFVPQYYHSWNIILQIIK